MAHDKISTHRDDTYLGPWVPLTVSLEIQVGDAASRPLRKHRVHAFAVSVTKVEHRLGSDFSPHRLAGLRGHGNELPERPCADGDDQFVVRPTGLWPVAGKSAVLRP